jgi:ABC-type phosphate/phosphonate transport system substrate-binding protein
MNDTLYDDDVTPEMAAICRTLNNGGIVSTDSLSGAHKKAAAALQDRFAVVTLTNQDGFEYIQNRGRLGKIANLLRGRTDFVAKAAKHHLDFKPA